MNVFVVQDSVNLYDSSRNFCVEAKNYPAIGSKQFLGGILLSHVAGRELQYILPRVPVHWKHSETIFIVSKTRKVLRRHYQQLHAAQHHLLQSPCQLFFPLIYLHLKHPTQSNWLWAKGLIQRQRVTLIFLYLCGYTLLRRKIAHRQDTDVSDKMSRWLMNCFAIPSVVFFCCLVQSANFSICFCSYFEHIGFQRTPAQRVIGQSTLLRGKYRMIIHSIQLCKSFPLWLKCKTNNVVRLLSGCKRSYSSSY